MLFEPKLTHQKLKELYNVKPSHYITATIIKMRLPNVNIASKDEDNAQVFGPHFDHVYNHHHPTYPNELQGI